MRGLVTPLELVVPYLRPVWAYQREDRLRLVTPIYHAEASAQAEALATATTGGKACQCQQGKRGRGGLGDKTRQPPAVGDTGIFFHEVNKSLEHV